MIYRARNARVFPGGCEHRAKYLLIFWGVIKHAKLLHCMQSIDVKMFMF